MCDRWPDPGVRNLVEVSDCVDTSKITAKTQNGVGRFDPANLKIIFCYPKTKSNT